MADLKSRPAQSGESPWGRARLKHHQLRSRLLSQIAAGDLRPGDVLPSEHQLAEAMQISRTTVRQTLGDLEREGHVRRVQGKGTFVADRPGALTSISRTASLALIAPEVARGYYPTLVAGFDRAANDSGRPIVVCNSNNEVDRQANHLMRLIDQRVAGILLNPSTHTVTPAYQVRLAQDAGIPVVLLHRGVPDAAAPLLELPTFDIGRRAGRLMLEAGHRRIAYLASHRYVASEMMEQGLREALEEAGIGLSEEWIDYGHLLSFSAADYQAYETYLEECLRTMFAGDQRPTALFVGFDATAEMLYLIAGRMGLRVPEDLSIVCFGGADRVSAIARRLTAITVDEEATARQAVALLLQMGEGRRPIRSPETTPMSLGLSRGATLSPPTEA